MPLLLLALLIALFYEDRSVVTVGPQEGGSEPARGEAQPDHQPARRFESGYGSRLAVGERYASLEDLEADQKAAGYVRIGSFGKNWPATVVGIEEDDDGISFLRQNGTRHNYTGFDGYRAKAVFLNGPGEKETIVVFRSAQKR